MNALITRPQQHNTLNVYRKLPPGCVTFLVNDHYSLPFIRPGECVVVDTADKTPRFGDIYVIEWNGGNRNLCQARHSKWASRDGAIAWMVGSMKTSSPEELQSFLDDASNRRSGAIPEWNGAWADGPFTFEHLESKLVGAVIGVFEPRASLRNHAEGAR